MSSLGWIITTGIAVAGVSAVFVVSWLRSRRRSNAEKHQLPRARQLFHLRREWLEAEFLTLASHSGRPRGLAWADCDFDDDVTFARDRTSGQLRAFVGVAISFEAIEGGGMEDNPNVSNVRAATAVFNFDGAWTTEGRAIFNLNPTEAIRHFQSELEMVE